MLDTSNSYADVLRKCKMVEHGGNPETLKKIIKEYGLSEEQLNINRSHYFASLGKQIVYKMRASLQDVFDNKVRMNGTKLIKRLVEENYKEYKCEKCGISDWMGEKLALQLHHKDGNHYNNSLDNIEMLCPNCHSQTDTFAGKSSRKKISIPQFENIKEESENEVPIKIRYSFGNICIKCNIRNTYSEDKICSVCKNNIKAKENRRKNNEYNVEDIIKLIDDNHLRFQEVADIYHLNVGIIIYDYKQYKHVENLSDAFCNRKELKQFIRTTPFTTIGKMFGVSDKAIKKWCIKMNLPHLVKEIKKYTDEEWETI